MYSFELKKHPQVLMREGPSENGGNGGNSQKIESKKTPGQIKEELQKSREIRDTNSKKETGQGNMLIEQKRVDEFRDNNPIQEYKNKLLEFCIKHPHLAANGKRLSKDDFILMEELEKINNIGGNNLTDYKALIETLIYIVKTKEFDTYTGFFSINNQKLRGNGQQVADYKMAIANKLQISIQTRQVQKSDKILHDFQEQQKSEEIRKKQEAKAAEIEIRKTVNRDSILAVFDGKSREEIQKSLNKLDITKMEFYQKYGKYLGVELSDIMNMLETARKAAENDILENSMWNHIGINRTKGAYIEKVSIAINTSAKEKRIVPVIFSNGKYEAMDKETMKLMFSNPESINIEFWKNIFKENFWETTLKEYGDNNLWAVGQYIKDRGYNTKLLTGITDTKRKNEVQGFFDTQINTHFIEFNVNTNKSEYTERLYEKIKQSIPGITLEIFKKIAPNGNIKGSELYKNLEKMTSPLKYIEFEKLLQNQIKELNIELGKEIKNSSDTLKNNGIETVTQAIKLLKGESGITETNTKGLKNLLDTKISALNTKDARQLLDFLGKVEGNDILKEKLIGLIQNKLNKETNNKNIAGSTIRQVQITQLGSMGVKNIITGKLDKIEISAGNAFAATEDMKEQREFMKEDTNIVDILKKYGYTVDMLTNPNTVLILQQKIKNINDGPGKNRLLSFLNGIKRSQEIQIRNYDTIIKEAGTEDSIKYISSISGKKETTNSIQAYQFMSQNIIPNVEYTQTPLGDQLSRMNVGEVRSLDTFVDKSSALSGSDFVKEYSVQLSGPDSYIIRSKSGTIIATSLNVNETTELVDDMTLFDAVGLNDLLLYLPVIKKEFSLKYGIDTRLDGKNNTEEKRKLLQKMYEVIFGERKETTDLNEMIRFFQSYSIQNGNKISSIRPYLKNKGFLYENNTAVSESILKAKL